jgi:hypothetical protein
MPDLRMLTLGVHRLMLLQYNTSKETPHTPDIYFNMSIGTIKLAKHLCNTSELSVIITQTAESPTAKRNYEPHLPEHLLLHEAAP